MSLLTDIPKAAIGAGVKVARLPIDIATKVAGGGNGRSEALYEAADERAEQADSAAERHRKAAERRRDGAEKRAEEAREEAHRTRHESKVQARETAASRKHTAKRDAQRRKTSPPRRPRPDRTEAVESKLEANEKGARGPGGQERAAELETEAAKAKAARKG